MRILRYIYYKFFIWAQKISGKESSPEYTAMFTTSFLFGMNLAVVSLIIMFIINDSKIDLLFTNKPVLYVFAIVVGLANYFLFVYDKRYVDIVTEFKKGSEQVKKRGTIYIWLYIFLTFFTMIMVPIFLREYF